MTGETTPKLEPLKIKCTSTSCDEGLHCFLKSKAMAEADRGKCRSCGAELIDWTRVHSRNLEDASFTFDSLRKEMIRHHFWHVTIDPHAIDYARRKGVTGLKDAAERVIRTSIGAAKPFRDGYQTPREGSRNPIHYAQHATASCCRKCVHEWHGIEPGRELTQAEIAYLAGLAMAFLLERLPPLTPDGEHVPPRRSEPDGEP